MIFCAQSSITFMPMEKNEQSTSCHTPNPQLNRYPSLAASYLAASLLEAGHEVKVCDLGAPFGPGIDDLGQLIDLWQPDLAGISLYTETALETYNLLKPFFNASIPWIAGGVHASSIPEEPLQFGLDITVIGEGERTIVTLADHLDTDRPLSGQLGKIAGIAFKDHNGRICKTRSRPKVEDIDTLPPPYEAKHLFPREWYLKDENMMLPSSLITSRGCQGRCIFCSSIVSGSRHRVHSASRVIEEMDAQVEAEGLSGFSFHDDAFTADSKRLFDLCALIKETFYQTPSWWCESRVDHINLSKANAMKEAGCHLVVFGVESGDRQILKKIGKGIEPEDAVTALESCKQAGLMTHVNMMFGFPQENRSHLNASLDFMKQIARLTDSFSPLGIPIPLPGTPLYTRYAKQYGFEAWWLDHRIIKALQRPCQKGDLQVAAPDKWTDLARQLEETVLKADFFKYSLKIKTKIRECLEFQRNHGV